MKFFNPFKKKRGLSNLGQSAMELAVFGSVLLFTIGSIIRTSASANQSQQRQLSVMRWALTASFLSSEGCKDWGGGWIGEGDSWGDSDNRAAEDSCFLDEEDGHSWGNASRNMASVLVVEDRLAPATDKYGSVDRVPYLYMGSGTHSRNLFFPVGPGEKNSLPVFDLFVNGKHFVFTTADEYTLSLDPESTFENPSDVSLVWEPECATKRKLEKSGGKLVVTTEQIGCPIVFAKTYNSANPGVRSSLGYCADTSEAHCPKDAKLIDARFDLDRSGTWKDPDPDFTDLELRQNYSWQWRAFAAFDPKKNRAVTLNAPWKPMRLKDENGMFDVDGDLKEEKVEKVLKKDQDGVFQRILVVDYQKGDLDLEQKDPPPGLQKDMEMYTWTDGDTTFALIEEGALYELDGDEKQYIRVKKKKDHIDMIRRVFQLSNDTCRFCNGGVPNDGTDPNCPLLQKKNPVDVCVSGEDEDICNSEERFSRVCMNTKTLQLYITSRIWDFSGRKWITDKSKDPYVDMITPPL